MSKDKTKFETKYPDVDLKKVKVLGKHPLFPHLAVVEHPKPTKEEKTLHVPLGELEAATGKSVTAIADVKVVGRGKDGKKRELTSSEVKAIIPERAKKAAEARKAKAAGTVALPAREKSEEAPAGGEEE